MLHPKLINPNSIAVIGGSDNVDSVGGSVLKNLIDQNFKGDLYVVSFDKSGISSDLVPIEIVTTRGIGKKNAFELYPHNETVYASINNYTINSNMSDGWHYVVMTYEKDASSNQLMLYVDGQSVKNGTYTQSIFNSAYNDFVVGTSYKGVMDDVSVWDSVLTSEDIYDN